MVLLPATTIAVGTFFLVNRWVHIAAGFIGFFVAPVALATRKGSPAHRLWGKVFLVR